MNTLKTFRYFSTFSGIGGFERGIQRAYEALHNLPELPARDSGLSDSHDIADIVERKPVPVCLGYSEIDKYAASIYQKHFPTHHNYGDITKLDADSLPDFDFLCGGFPCQAFSIAGKRGGFSDTRGTLFFDLARILKAKQPRLFLFENVKGLLSHDNGKTFATIISTLDELGYDLQWQVLNSKNHGVPQNRERVFIVGHLRGTTRPEIFPLREADGAADQGLEQGDSEVAATLRSRYGNGSGSHITVGTLRTHKDGEGFDKLKYNNGTSKETRPDQALSSMREADVQTEGEGRRFDVASSLQQDDVLQQGLYEGGLSGKTQEGEPKLDDSSLSRSELEAEEGSVRSLLNGEENRNSSSEWGLAGQHNRESTGDLQRLSYETASDSGKKNELSKEESGQSWKIRRLTEVECERLQSFPDNWTAFGADGKAISSTQRYKTLGNAVTVNVIEAIMARIFESL